jgi:SAM-dependent methyltransferase
MMNRVLSRQAALRLSLEERIQLEKTLTDAEGDKFQIQTAPLKASYADYRNSSPWRRCLFDFLEPLQEKTILDLGCGYNPTPIYLALAGAKRVYACDVSPKAVEYVRRTAEEHGLADRIEAFVAPGEHLPLADESIDVVHGEAVLHHLDISAAGRELARVLRIGGKAGFKDPLGHNRALEFARDYLWYGWKKAAKGTDRPLRFAEIEKFASNFNGCQSRGFCFLSMAALVCGRGKSHLRNWLEPLDERLLTTFPSLRKYSRFVVTCVEKGHVN